MEMRFEEPLALLLLFLLPLLYYLSRRSGRATLSSSTTVAFAKGALKPSLRRRLLWVPGVLRLLSIALIILSIARPQEGKEGVRDYSKGVAIMMVVDRSRSMSAQMSVGGKRMSRLDVVKDIFKDFVMGGSGLSGRHNDLLGMVSFARYADTACPLTLAHGALTHILDGVELVQRDSEDGTAIGDAIALAAARLKEAEKTLERQRASNDTSKSQADYETMDYEIKSKVIILLTDGENTTGERTPLQGAELAKEWGIKIYAIGVGSRDDFIRQRHVFGSFFSPMLRGVDEATLKQVADATGGAFYLAKSAQALREVYEEIDEMEKSEVESYRYFDYREAFRPLVFSVLFLLCLEMCLRCTYFRKIP